ncbi:MAG TPA: DUF1275 family protein [Acinetobacter sp.]|nr:DUF1275 family protein [Acinetobacter sp.]
MLLVLAMVIQKAIHGIHWIKGSLTMAMTGSITQLMLDMGDFSLILLQKKSQIYQRLYSILLTMFSFTFGCVVAVIVYKFTLSSLVIVPSILLILTYIYRENYKKA